MHSQILVGHDIRCRYSCNIMCSRLISLQQFCKHLLQFRVLRLCLLQDGDIGVGVFPECEAVLCSECGQRTWVLSTMSGTSHRAKRGRRHCRAALRRSRILRPRILVNRSRRKTARQCTPKGGGYRLLSLDLGLIPTVKTDRRTF